MRRRGTARTAPQQGTGHDDLVGRYEAALAAIDETCARVRQGDLEARVPWLGDDDVLRSVRSRVNDLVDVADAFVREAGASLLAASQNRHHRRFLERGMPGAFRAAAATANEAGESMRLSAERIQADRENREELSASLAEVAGQVASMSVELSASADSLAGSARDAVGETSAAAATMQSLDRASSEIQQALTLIKQVAAQTRLLALNATIEAARAGDAGRGFAVVAHEVKALAGEAHRSSEDIEVQIAAAQQAASDAVASMARISAVIEAMDQQVAGVAAAAGGRADGSEAGLAHMAEVLRSEIDQLAASD